MWTGDAADLLRKVKFGRKALPPHLEQEVVCEIIDDADSGGLCGVMVEAYDGAPCLRDNRCKNHTRVRPSLGRGHTR